MNTGSENAPGGGMANTPPSAVGPYRRSAKPEPPPPPSMRPVYLTAIASVLFGLVMALTAREVTHVEVQPALLADVPIGVLDALAAFPPPEAELPPATPLSPLLVADAPDSLAILSPDEGATRVTRGHTLSIRFNRPMVRGSQVGVDVAEPPIEFDPAVAGTFRWTSRSTLVFTPARAVFDRNVEASFMPVEGVTSLDGEELYDETPRVAVFDGSPRIRRHVSSVSAGQPLPIWFDSQVSLAELSSQMFAYEMGGGYRPIPITAAPGGSDDEGNVLVELRTGRTLEPGARIGVAIAPRWQYWGGSQPSVLTFTLAPRPRITGIGCEISSWGSARCTFSEDPGQIVDIGPALRVLASHRLAELGAGAVTVVPPLRDLRVRLEGTGGEVGRVVAIEGEWEPDQVYEVRVGAMRTADGERVVPMNALAVRSRGYAPSVTAPSGRLAWEAGAPMRMRIRGVHVDAGAVLVRPVPAGSEVQALLHPQQFVAAADVTQPLARYLPDARPNRFARGEVELDPLGVGDMATVGFAAGAGRTASSITASFVQRTDLGITSAALRDGMIVWVSSIASAQPVADVEIALYDGEGTPITTARTDANGAAWIRLDGQHGASGVYDVMARPVVIVARRGAARAAMLFDARSSVTASTLGLPVHDGTREATEAPLRATVFADRGAYRPGETLHVVAMARRMAGATAMVPPSMTVSLRVNGSGPIPIVETRARLERGTVEATFTLPEGIALGDYDVELLDANGALLGSAGVQIAEFRQPRMRVDLVAPTGTLRDGDTLTVPVRGRYLFGAGVGGGAYTYTVSRGGAARFPSRFAEYQFGPLAGSGRRGTVAEGEGTLDARGDATISTVVALAAPIRTEIHVEAEVRDATGETISASRSLTVYPADAEAGIRSGRSWVPLGETLRLEGIAVGVAGETVEGLAMTARFVREGWHGWFEWSGESEEADDGDAGYRLRRAQGREVISTCALVSAASPATCELTPTRSGTYVMELELRDAAGRLSLAQRRLYVAGPDESPDRDPPGAPIAITPSRTTWAVGESAQIAFESPWPDAQALVVVHHGSVLSVEHRRVTGGGQTLSVPVTAEMVPNAFVTVALVRPRSGEPGADVDLHAPDLRFGSARLTVRPADSLLDVTIEAPAERRPGETAEVAVVVRDSAGNAVPGAQVALWAVDEGTLRLTGYQAPEATRGFFVARAAQLALEDLRRGLVSRVSPPIETEASGDGEYDSDSSPQDLEERERFDPTPLWAPRLTTGADGRALASFVAPDRPTEYRVMAVVLDSGLRAGRAAASVTVTRPLVVRTAFPRFATHGDRFEAVAFIHNAADTAIRARFCVRLASDDCQEREIEIAARGEARVSSPIEVASEELFTLRAEARAQIDGVAVEHASESRISVVPRGRWVRRRALLGGAGERPLALSYPSGTGQRGELLVTVASHPFVGLDALLDSLDESWWSGTEVEASYARFSGGLGRSERREAERRERASIALRRLLRTRSVDGGFPRYTPTEGGRPIQTAWAVRALVEAQEAGMTLPPGLLNELLDRLETMVRSGAFGESYSAGGRDAWVLALRLLGQSGRTMPQLDSLFEQREHASPYHLAQLAMALPEGDRRATTALYLAVHRLDPELPIAGIELAESDRAPAFVRDIHQWAATLEAAARVPSGRPFLQHLSTELLRAAAVSRYGFGLPSETAETLAALRACAARFGSGEPLEPELTLDGQSITPADVAPVGALFRVPFARVVNGQHQMVARGREGDPIFAAVDSMWSVPIGEPEAIARGRGVSLHRVFETAGGAPIADGAHVAIGTMIRVRVYVHSERRSPDDVAVRDPLGAGFEPVDAGMDTTPRATLAALLGASPEDDAIDPRGFHAARTLSYVRHRSIDTHAVTHYLDGVPSGLHELTYAVRATTPGTFTIPPAQLEAMRDPDWVARTTATTLIVDP